jgi:transposase
MRPLPNWAGVQKELKAHKGVTLQLLWKEYRERHPDDAYSRSRFCELYREWREAVDVTMRQDHVAGEKLFVDYAGVTVPITDPATGKIRHAQVFVAVLGASNYTYAEATWSQQLRDWIASHVRAFAFFGGVPQLVIPDNLKAGVTSPCYYEPDLNRTYQDLAEHYGIAVAPSRVRRPQDKASAEKGVQQIEREILAPLRHVAFFSLAELNREIRRLLSEHNERDFQKLPGSRRSHFEELDRPALRPLPAERYEYAEWKRQTLPPDYHVEVGGHHYSAPFKLKGKKLDVRYTDRTVEVFYKGHRAASHVRSHAATGAEGGKTTASAHMPERHRAYAERSSERYLDRARKLGEATGLMVERILEARKHPQLAYRSCEGVLRLAREYGAERLEAACCRALLIRAHSYSHLRSTLENSLEHDLPADSAPSGDTLPTVHVNLRGGGYYQ